MYKISRNEISNIRQEIKKVRKNMVLKGVEELTIVDKKLIKVYNETDDYIYELFVENSFGDIWKTEYRERWMNSWRGQDPTTYKIGDDLSYLSQISDDTMAPVKVKGVEEYEKKLKELEKEEDKLLQMVWEFRNKFDENAENKEFSYITKISRKGDMFTIYPYLIYKGYLVRGNRYYYLDAKDVSRVTKLHINDSRWWDIVECSYKRGDKEYFLWQQSKRAIKALLKDNIEHLPSLQAEEEWLELTIL